MDVLQPRYNNQPESEHRQLIEFGIKLGRSENNLLLTRQTYELARAAYGGDERIPESIRDPLTAAIAELDWAWREGWILRWMDTPLVGESDMSELERCSARMERTLGWVENVRAGEGYVLYVTAPARNEAVEITGFLRSLKEHPLEHPIVAIIIADNNSTDETIDLAFAEEANVVHSVIPGVGPTRQVAFDHVRDHRVLPDHQSLVMTTDSDVRVSPALTDIIVNSFADPNNEHKTVANGQVYYRVQLSRALFEGVMSEEELALLDSYRDPDDPNAIVIRDFTSYKLLTGSKTFRECFAALGYDLDHFILGDTCHMLPGPFSVERLSVPVDYEYPRGKHWEQHDKALRFATELDFAIHGMTIGDGMHDAYVEASPRAIVGAERYTPGQISEYVPERFIELRQNGIRPFQSDEGHMTELESIRQTIEDTQHRLYELAPDQIVIGYFPSQAEAEAAARSRGYEHFELRPALHAATHRELGLVALIGSRLLYA